MNLAKGPERKNKGEGEGEGRSRERDRCRKEEQHERSKSVRSPKSKALQEFNAEHIKCRNILCPYFKQSSKYVQNLKIDVDFETWTGAATRVSSTPQKPSSLGKLQVFQLHAVVRAARLIGPSTGPSDPSSDWPSDLRERSYPSDLHARSVLIGSGPSDLVVRRAVRPVRPIRRVDPSDGSIGLSAQILAIPSRCPHRTVRFASTDPCRSSDLASAVRIVRLGRTA